MGKLSDPGLGPELELGNGEMGRELASVVGEGVEGDMLALPGPGL
jgi:hypothetical protein